MQRLVRTMAKRARSSSVDSAVPKHVSGFAHASGHPVKRSRADTKFLPNKIATAENAAKADKNPPFSRLVDVMKSATKASPGGESVAYWMRMQDMRGA